MQLSCAPDFAPSLAGTVHREEMVVVPVPAMPGTHALQGPERSSRIGKDASYTPLLLRVDMIFKLLGTARSKQPTTARLWKMLDGRLWLWGEQGSM